MHTQDMRKFLPLLFIFGLVSVPASGQVSFQFNTGGSFASSPDEFSDFYGTGYNLGAGIRFEVAPSVEISISGQYNDFLVNEEEFYDRAGVSESQRDQLDLEAGASIISGEVDLRYNIATDGPVKPYLKGGPGFYRTAEDNGTLSGPGGSATFDGDSETSFGLNFGVGLAYYISSQASIFAEPSYAIAFTEDESTQYLPIRFGVSFSQ